MDALIAQAKGDPHIQSRIEAIHAISVQARSRCLPNHEEIVSLFASILATETRNPIIQAECIRSMSKICSSDIKTAQWKRCLEIFCDFAQDIDARNRCASLEAIETLYHRSGGTNGLYTSAYQVAVENLRDSAPRVRIQALRIAWLTGERGDATFKRLSYAIADEDPSVRAHAISLLAALDNVSTKVLNRALSRNPTILSGYLASAASLPESKPWKWARLQSIIEHERNGRIEVNEKGTGCAVEDWQSLLSGISQGDMIDGLEDENVMVRQAAMDAITELSLKSPLCAPSVIDYVVDMLHDEMETARLYAAKSLIRMGNIVSFEKMQLEAILSHLIDANSELRMLLHRVLESIEIPNSDCLYMAVNALLANITRFRTDEDSVYSCLVGIGRRNSGLVQFLVEPLLHFDHRFAPVEPNTGDNLYNGILILIANGADRFPSILSLLPPFCFGHLDALYDKFPQHLPSNRAVLKGKNFVEFVPRDMSHVPYDDTPIDALIARLDIQVEQGTVIDECDMRKLARGSDLAAFSLVFIRMVKCVRIHDMRGATSAVNEMLVAYGGLQNKSKDMLMSLRLEDHPVLPRLADIVANSSLIKARSKILAPLPNSTQQSLRAPAGWPLPMEIEAQVTGRVLIDGIQCIIDGVNVKQTLVPSHCHMITPSHWHCVFKGDINVGSWTDPTPVTFAIGIDGVPISPCTTVFVIGV